MLYLILMHISCFILLMTYYLLFILNSKKNILTVSYIYLMNSFFTPIFSFHPYHSRNETLFLNKSPSYVHVIFGLWSTI